MAKSPKTKKSAAETVVTPVTALPAKAAKSEKKAKPAKTKPAVAPAEPAWTPNPGDPLGKLYARVDASKHGNPEKSYTAKLFTRGRAKIAQKLGEEAVETTIELVKGERDGVIYESADLLYHLMVAWVDAGIVPDDVWLELQRRQGISGLVEKASRTKE